MKIKKSVIAVAIVACGLCLASCSGNDLTSSVVKSEVKRVLGPALDQYETTTIQTGYYELNNAAARFELRKLAAAGVITYRAENIIENRTSWGKRKYDHIFVTVELTKDGKKYVLSEEDLEKMKEAREEHEAELKETIVIDKEEFPEAAVLEEETIPVIDDAATESASSKTTTDSETFVCDAPETIGNSSATEIDVQTASSYEKALAKVNTTDVVVKAFKYDIAKVYKIKCTQSMLEKGVAEATVVFECENSTPFGRILKNSYEGEQLRRKYDFILYTDGWQLED